MLFFYYKLVSTHMVMLKRVTITFFKSIALYSILLLSFGLVFYSLYGEDKALKEKQMNDTSLKDDRNELFNQIDSDKLQSQLEMTDNMESSNFSFISTRFGDYDNSANVPNAPPAKETDSDFKTFRTPLVAILRTLVMLTGDFTILYKIFLFIIFSQESSMRPKLLI